MKMFRQSTPGNLLPVRLFEQIYPGNSGINEPLIHVKRMLTEDEVIAEYLEWYLKSRNLNGDDDVEFDKEDLFDSWCINEVGWEIGAPSYWIEEINNRFSVGLDKPTQT